MSEVSISNTQHKKGVKKMKTKQAKQGTIQPIHPFQTLEEEAAFWDTHSALDEINEGTVAGFHQANKTDTLTIRPMRIFSGCGKRPLSKVLGQAPSPLSGVMRFTCKTVTPVEGGVGMLPAFLKTR